MHTSDLVTTAGAAAMLGVGRTTIKRWAVSGRLPATKLPGDRGPYLFAVSDVRALAASRGDRA